MAAPQAFRVSLRQANAIIAKPHIKSFSSSRQCKRGGGGSSKQLARQQSIMSKMSQIKGNELPDDVGLIPEMIIKPLSKSLPSPFSIKRLRVETRILLQKIVFFGTMVFAKKWTGTIDPDTGKKVRERLPMTERYEAVRQLHQQLYSAIAERNEQKIEEIACTGVKRQVQVRIANKKYVDAPKERLSIRYRGLTFKKLPWYLQNLIPPRFRSTQILVDRFVPLGMGDESNTIRQVVVKLKSSQTLSKEDGSPQETFDKEELIVMQSQKISGEQLPWKFWGTIEGTTPQEIDALLQKNKGSFSSKLKESFSGVQSSTGGAGMP